MELASAYYSRGQMTTALDQVKLAIAADPLYGEAFNLRGLIYSNLGETTLAEESFKRALQLNARDADTMHNYGWFLCQQQALRRIERACSARRSPCRSTAACRARCSPRASARRTPASSPRPKPRWRAPTSSIRRARSRRPTSSEVLYRRGEFERARFYVRRVNSQPEVSNAQTLWLAARIENKLGNRQGAAEFGTQLRNRFPDSREAAAYARGAFDE